MHQVLLSFREQQTVERTCFFGNDVTSFFFTNQEVNVENKERIKKLSTPVVRIEAFNSCKEAKRIKPDKFYGLKNLLFLAVGAKVVLEYNLCPELGLYNGATGIVKDIVYGDEDNDKPPRLLNIAGWK